jgi:aspartyl/glutamyl-tRNA(Asn/Gln) amidotransferase C subunit
LKNTEVEGLIRAAEVIKIEMNKEELDQLQGQFTQYLQWLKTLVSVDCSEIEPVLFSHGAINVLREDKAEKADLKNVRTAAANFEEGYYVVPPIIE